MPTLAYKTEQVMSILRELPPAKVNEVIDFAEYLKTKTGKADVSQKHDQWVRSIVGAALVEANNPETKFIPHSEVKSRWAEKKKILQERIGKGHLS